MILKAIIAIAILFFSLGHHVFAQSLSGLQVGDAVSATARLGLKPFSRESDGPFDYFNYRLRTHNELSVTVDRQSKKIVYLESDWGGRDAGTKSDYPGFLFGKTNLAEIRKKMGSNGMAFSERPPVLEVEGGAVTFNTYEIGDVLVTFVTKVRDQDLPLVEKKRLGLAEAAKLDAIILTTPDYAATNWGKQIKDPAYRKGVW